MANYFQKAPGVYINEIQVQGPIAGVGTSTAAFLGVCQKGPINTPGLVTSWSDFVSQFGTYVGPPHYLAYAVRGFFDNGGTLAYIVRVSNGTYATAFLPDQSGGATKALKVQALAIGTNANGTSVAVADDGILTAATLTKTAVPPSVASGVGTTITLVDSSKATLFHVGDFVSVNNSEHAEISSIGSDGKIIVAAPLNGNWGNGGGQTPGTLRIADLIAGQTVIRVTSANPNALLTGMAIKIDAGGGTNEWRVVNSVVPFPNDATPTYLVTLDRPLTNAYSTSIGTVNVTSNEFKITCTIPNLPNNPNQVYRFLSMDPRHPNYFGNVAFNGISVTLPGPLESPSTQLPPNNRPSVASTPFVAGVAETGANLNEFQAGLTALEGIEDVSLVCVPGKTDGAGIQSAAVVHCEATRSRFAILDASNQYVPDVSPGQPLQVQRAALESGNGYAALYYPWLNIPDPLNSGSTLYVPPSGHVAGLYARVDGQRGVHKAPANELLSGVIGLDRIVSGVKQGTLNEAGVDVIRVFPGQSRPNVYGGRTTCAGNVNWRYVNVRRLFIYVEESIRTGIRWAVFEPNDLGLWKKVNRTITEFLARVWRSGALFGATAAEAFYVKVDEELNPPALRALGQLNIEIGIAPVRPAEFVTVSIGIWDGGSRVTEG